MPDHYNAWRCLEKPCPTRGEWQTAEFPETAESAWTEHWQREHNAKVIKP